MVSELVRDILEQYNRQDLIEKVTPTTDRFTTILAECFNHKNVDEHAVDDILFYAIQAGIERSVMTSEGFVEYLKHNCEGDFALLVNRHASKIRAYS